MRTTLIGTDEAGYGPNLGPLVISATQWDVLGGMDSNALWSALQAAVSQSPPDDGRVYLADSKQVYQPGRGLAVLERGVLALLGTIGLALRDTQELRETLTNWRGPAAEEFIAPWYREETLALPVAATTADIQHGRELLRRGFAAAGCELRSVRSDVVSESRFNRLCDAAGSKGAVLTEATLRLAGSFAPEQDQPALVLCDKHGGRNTYAAALTACGAGEFVVTRRELREQSVYVAGSTEYRFETGAERHLPVAVASMVSKYVREVSMLAFNAWWRRHCPDVKPTQGYPQDAVRFRGEIAAAQVTAGVSDYMLWRRR